MPDTLNAALSDTWDRLTKQPADPLLALIGLFKADPRTDKIDLGVGVYKDETGRTPVFAAVKAAERRLLERQDTKAYLGSEGDAGFVERLVPLIFGIATDRQGVTGLQTPGGTGALRLGAELLQLSQHKPRIHLGTPAWANHRPLFEAAGLEVITHRYYDPAFNRVTFEDIFNALEQAQAGDAVLLQASGHNPTGSDLSIEQWSQLADLMARRRLVPFIDMAYQGLADGLEADAEGARLVFARCPNLLVAYSCDKNFGLYRDRVGALFALSDRPERLTVINSILAGLARSNWSMPPDHGAAVVRLILEDAALTEQWKSELEAMRSRIDALRVTLAGAHPLLSVVAVQKGMFSLLRLSPAQISRLREDFGIYVAGSGRISLSGLNEGNLDHFIKAIRAFSPESTV